MNYLIIFVEIFNKQENTKLQEQNLDAVILINPNNEEAVYSLAKLKLIHQIIKSKELNVRLKSICLKLCDKSKIKD